MPIEIPKFLRLGFGLTQTLVTEDANGNSSIIEPGKIGDDKEPIAVNSVKTPAWPIGDGETRATAWVLEHEGKLGQDAAALTALRMTQKARIDREAWNTPTQEMPKAA